MEIKITTASDIPGLKIKKSYERVEITSLTLSKADDKLISKAEKISNKINWLIDVKYYQRPNRKYLMSGTPVIMVEDI